MGFDLIYWCRELYKMHVFTNVIKELQTVEQEMCKNT